MFISLLFEASISDEMIQSSVTSFLYRRYRKAQRQEDKSGNGLNRIEFSVALTLSYGGPYAETHSRTHRPAHVLCSPVSLYTRNLYGDGACESSLKDRGFSCLKCVALRLRAVSVLCGMRGANEVPALEQKETKVGDWRGFVSTIFENG